jgi:hypothetical protein
MVPSFFEFLNGRTDIEKEGLSRTDISPYAIKECSMLGVHSVGASRRVRTICHHYT